MIAQVAAVVKFFSFDESSVTVRRRFIKNSLRAFANHPTVGHVFISHGPTRSLSREASHGRPSQSFPIPGFDAAHAPLCGSYRTTQRLPGGRFGNVARLASPRIRRQHALRVAAHVARRQCFRNPVDGLLHSPLAKSLRLCRLCQWVRRCRWRLLCDGRRLGM
jgi:hypothetical protein